MVCMVWQGQDVVAQGRRLIGATNPLQADIGSIRGEFALVTGRNLIHGADSEKAAAREIKIYFKDSEICEWEKAGDRWIYE